MKSCGLLLSLFLVCTASLFSQQKAAVNENKYRINLPDYWKPGNKVWQILSDKLPQVCEELKDKELCGDDCRPKYSIEFMMSEPSIHDYRANPISSGTNASGFNSRSYNFVTSYSFECELLLFDDTDKLLTRIILVEADEVWTVTNRAELRSFTPQAPQRTRFAGYPSSQIMATNTNYQAQQAWASSARAVDGQTPYSYINENREQLSPQRKDMLMVVDQKMRNLSTN